MASNRFTDLLYQTSIGIGDVISLNVLDQGLRPIRSLGLQYARIGADLKSLTPRGQGASLRIQRRVAGRISGRIGQTVIPQTMGVATRIANRFYGKIATQKVQNYYNNKVQQRTQVFGQVLTEDVKAKINKQMGGKLEREYLKALKDMQKKGLTIEEFSMPNLLRDIQYNMIGGVKTGNADGNREAPIVTGNLRDSIRIRGIYFSDSRSVATGRLSIGSGPGGNLREADQAPYWWKTVYGGWYPGRESFSPARNFGWLGKSLMAALTHYFPQVDYDLVVNGKKMSNKMNYMSYQPVRPPQDAFELSVENAGETQAVEFVSGSGEVPF